MDSNVYGGRGSETFKTPYGQFLPLPIPFLSSFRRDSLMTPTNPLQAPFNGTPTPSNTPLKISIVHKSAVQVERTRTFQSLLERLTSNSFWLLKITRGNFVMLLFGLLNNLNDPPPTAMRHRSIRLSCYFANTF